MGPQSPSPEGRGLPSARLARFAAALQELTSAPGVHGALRSIVDLAGEVVPGVEIADVLLPDARGAAAPLDVDPVAAALGELQRDTTDCRSGPTTPRAAVAR